MRNGSPIDKSKSGAEPKLDLTRNKWHGAVVAYVVVYPLRGTSGSAFQADTCPCYSRCGARRLQERVWWGRGKVATVVEGGDSAKGCWSVVLLVLGSSFEPVVDGGKSESLATLLALAYCAMQDQEVRQHQVTSTCGSEAESFPMGGEGGFVAAKTAVRVCIAVVCKSWYGMSRWILRRLCRRRLLDKKRCCPVDERLYVLTFCSGGIRGTQR